MTLPPLDGSGSDRARRAGPDPFRKIWAGAEPANTSRQPGRLGELAAYAARGRGEEIKARPQVSCGTAQLVMLPELRQVVAELNTLASASADDVARAISSPALGFLSPNNLERVLAVATSEEGYGGALSRVAAGIRHFDGAQHERIVSAVISSRLGDPLNALGHDRIAILSESQGDQFIAAIIDLPNAWHKSVALGGLWRGMAHQRHAQRNTVVDATFMLDNGDPSSMSAFRAIGAGIPYLSIARRREVIDFILRIRNEQARSYALSGLGICMDRLTEQQRRDVVNDATRMTDEINKAIALEGLWAGMSHMNEDLRKELVAALIAMHAESNKADALRTIGDALAYMNEMQRTHLVHDVTSFRESFSKGFAIGGLGAGARHLSAKQRGRLVAGLRTMRANLTEELRIASEEGLAGALGGLGSATEYLSKSQRGNLVHALSYIDSDFNKTRAIAALDAAGGLADGLASLSESQCDGVIEVMIGMQLEPLMATCIEAIGRKAMSALSERQRLIVIAAGRSIEDKTARVRALSGLLAAPLRSIAL